MKLDYKLKDLMELPVINLSHIEKLMKLKCTQKECILKKDKKKKVIVKNILKLQEILKDSGENEK